MINLDVAGIHPTKLCSNCVRKLRRLNTTSSLDHKHQDIVDFHQHCSENCTVCNNTLNIYKFQLLTIEHLTLHKIITAADNYGFLYANKMKERLRLGYVC